MATLPSANHAEQRRAPRHEVSFQAWLLGDNRRIAVHVVDLSRHGLMVRSSAPLAQGDGITIEVPRFGRHRATVRWVLGGRIGCEFAVSLTEHQCARILADPPAPPAPWIRF